MSQSNSKYFCLLKGNWQDRFFELIEMFQISLHERFAIGVPDNLLNAYNRIVVYGLSLPDGSSPGHDAGISDSAISESFYGTAAGVGVSGQSSMSDLENSSVNLFEHRLSYN